MMMILGRKEREGDKEKEKEIDQKRSKESAKRHPI